MLFPSLRIRLSSRKVLLSSPSPRSRPSEPNSEGVLNFLLLLLVLVLWAKHWLDFKSRVLSARDEGLPFLPVPLVDGGWGSRPITSTEAIAWIRSFASEVFDHDKTVRFSSHSCKATTLSWACKFGVSDSVEALLSYHRGGQHRMMGEINYS